MEMKGNKSYVGIKVGQQSLTGAKADFPRLREEKITFQAREKPSAPRRFSRNRTLKTVPQTPYCRSHRVQILLGGKLRIDTEKGGGVIPQNEAIKDTEPSRPINNLAGSKDGVKVSTQRQWGSKMENVKVGSVR